VQHSSPEDPACIYPPPPPAESNRSFVTFCYDNLQWDYGDVSVGKFANAGFNSGTNDPSQYYSLPGSFTANDTQLACGGGGTGVRVAGRVFSNACRAAVPFSVVL
jgi:hypothetical protein